MKYKKPFTRNKSHTKRNKFKFVEPNANLANKPLYPQVGVITPFIVSSVNYAVPVCSRSLVNPSLMPEVYLSFIFMTSFR